MKTSLYRVLLPSKYVLVFEEVKRYLPDAYRTPQAFLALLTNGTTLSFELGDFQGAFWLTDVFVGWKAGIHIVLWQKELFGRSAEAKQVIRELMHFYSLQRLEAFIPITMRSAGRYAERCGFKMEGILRQATIYDGVMTDMVAYSVIRGEE